MEIFDCTSIFRLKSYCIRPAFATAGCSAADLVLFKYCLFLIVDPATYVPGKKVPFEIDLQRGSNQECMDQSKRWLDYHQAVK